MRWQGDERLPGRYGNPGIEAVGIIAHGHNEGEQLLFGFIGSREAVCHLSRLLRQVTVVAKICQGSCDRGVGSGEEGGSDQKR